MKLSTLISNVVRINSLVVFFFFSFIPFLFLSWFYCTRPHHHTMYTHSHEHILYFVSECACFSRYVVFLLWRRCLYQFNATFDDYVCCSFENVKIVFCFHLKMWEITHSYTNTYTHVFQLLAYTFWCYLFNSQVWLL